MLDLVAYAPGPGIVDLPVKRQMGGDNSGVTDLCLPWPKEAVGASPSHFFATMGL